MPVVFLLFFFGVAIGHSNLCTYTLNCSLISVSDSKQYHTTFQDGGKISPSVSLKKEKDKFSRQCKAFMDGLDRLIVSLPLIAVGFLIRKVL